jgi:sulfur transfer protein SufE
MIVEVKEWKQRFRKLIKEGSTTASSPEIQATQEPTIAGVGMMVLKDHL